MEENQVLNYTVQAQAAERMFAMSKAGKDLEMVIKDMVRQVLECPPPALTQALFDHSGLRNRLAALEESVATEEHIMREIAAQEVRGVKLMAVNHEDELSSLKHELSLLKNKVDNMPKEMPRADAKRMLQEVFEQWISKDSSRENAGAYWTIEEDERLCEILKMLVDPISAIHGRTAGAIYSRIRHLQQNGVNPFSRNYKEGLRSNMQYYREEG